MTRLGGPDNADLLHHVKVITVHHYDIAEIRYTIMDVISTEVDCTWQGTRLLGGDLHKICGAMDQMSLDSTDLETILLEDFGIAQSVSNSSSNLDDSSDSDNEHSSSGDESDDSSEQEDEYEDLSSSSDQRSACDSSEQEEADQNRQIKSHPVSDVDDEEAWV